MKLCIFVLTIITFVFFASGRGFLNLKNFKTTAKENIFQEYFKNLHMENLEILISFDNNQNTANQDLLIDWVASQWFPVSVIEPFSFSKLVDNSEYPVEYQLTILLFESKENLIRQLNFLKKSKYWRPHQQFILFTLTQGLDLEEIFQELFFKFYLKLVFVLLYDSNDIFTIRPFTKSSDCLSSLKVIKYMNNYSEAIFRGKHYGMCNLTFYLHLPSEPYVSWGTQYGPTGMSNRLVDVISNVGGFNFQIKEVEQRYITELITHGHFNDFRDYGMVKFNDVGAIGNLGQSVVVPYGFDFTFYTFQEQLVWIVPIAKLVPYWKYLVKVYTPVTYFGFIFPVILILIVGQIVSKLAFKQQKEVCLLIGLIGFFFGQSIPKIDRYFPRRVLLLSMFVAQLHNTAFYGGMLSFFYNNPPREHQIATTAEIFKNNIPIKLQPILENLFSAYPDAENREILKRSTTMTMQPEVLMASMKDGKNNAFLNSKKNGIYFRKLLRKPKKLPFYVTDDSRMTYYLSLIIQRHHPLLESIDKIILNMHMIGVFEKIISSYWYELELSLAHPVLESDPLLLKHLYGHFITLFIGLGIACISLIIEILVNVFDRGQEPTVSGLLNITRCVRGTKATKRTNKTSESTFPSFHSKMKIALMKKK